MKSKIQILSLVLMGLLIIGCEKENFNLEGRQMNNLIIAPLSLDAVVEESMDSYQIHLVSTQVGSRYGNYYSVGTVSEGAAGPILYLGIAAYPTFQSRRETFPLSFKFRVDEIDPEVAPSEEELKRYFSIGREFSFGDDNGQVQFDILLIGGDQEDRRSRSEYVDVPEGRVKVEQIAPFIAPLSDISGGDREYLMITFSFSGIVGVHSAVEQQIAEQNGEAYIASRNVNVSGTTTLVLAANPG